MTGVQSRGAAPRPVVFSLTAWLILAPFLTTAYGGFDEATTADERLVGFGMAVLVHLATLLVFLGGAFVERRLIAWPWARAGWVAAVVVALAIVRPLAISGLHALVGIPTVTTPDWQRFLLNIAVLGLGVVVIHAAAMTVARRLVVRARLDAVLASTGRNAASASHSTTLLVDEFVRAVADPVRRALVEAVRRPFDAAGQADALRGVAHDVVRPLSHHVFAAAPESAGALSLPQDARRGRGPSSFRIARRLLPASAWAPSSVFAALMFPAALAGYGVVGGLVRTLAALGVMLLGCWLLDLVRLRVRWAQLALLTLGYGLVGVGAAAMYLDVTVLGLPALGPLRTADSLLALWVYIPVAFLVLAMLFVVSRSEVVEARGIEAELAGLLLAGQREAVAAQLEHDTMRMRLARVLHNQVQGEIIALALRLRLGSAGAADVEGLIERVDHMLTEAVAPGTSSNEPAETIPAAVVERNARLAIAPWSHALDVRSEAEPAAWEWLAPRPDATAVLLDAAVEGLTNAVRHDEARSARIAFSCTTDGVRLELRAPGRLRGADVGDGFGLADLRRRGAQVTLGQHGREVVLTVDVAEV